MNEQATMIEKIASLPQIEFDRLRLGAKVVLAKEELASIKAEFQATLPYATDEQFEVIRYAAETETEVEPGHVIGEDFILNDVQKQLLKIARDSRKAHLEEHGRSYVDEVIADKEQVVTSFKVRALKSGGTRTVVAFTKGKPKVAAKDQALALLSAIEQAQSLRA